MSSWNPCEILEPSDKYFIVSTNESKSKEINYLDILWINVTKMPA